MNESNFHLVYFDGLVLLVNQIFTFATNSLQQTEGNLLFFFPKTS